MTAERVSVDDAAKRLGVARQRAYELVYNGTLPHVRENGRIWILADVIERRQQELHLLRSRNCVSTAEVAEFFGVHAKTVRDWHHQGRLVAVKLNNRLCFNPDEVVAFVMPTTNHAGRNPVRSGTRTLRGRRYPPPAGVTQIPTEREPNGHQDQPPRGGTDGGGDPL